MCIVVLVLHYILVIYFVPGICIYDSLLCYENFNKCYLILIHEHLPNIKLDLFEKLFSS